MKPCGNTSRKLQALQTYFRKAKTLQKGFPQGAPVKVRFSQCLQGVQLCGNTSCNPFRKPSNASLLTTLQKTPPLFREGVSAKVKKGRGATEDKEREYTSEDSR